MGRKTLIHDRATARFIIEKPDWQEFCALAKANNTHPSKVIRDFVLLKLEELRNEGAAA